MQVISGGMNNQMHAMNSDSETDWNFLDTGSYLVGEK